MTLVASVTKAAITSSVSPEIATALETVTVPVVLPPMALNSAAVIAVPASSLMVTVAVDAVTLVSSVTKAAMT